MSRSALKGVQAAAGNAGEAVYVEDVFSTYLYDGNSSTQVIDNGIDLSGEGGLVWLKNRTQSGGYNHCLFDTERGAEKRLYSNDTSAETTGYLSSFNNNGFTLASGFYENQSPHPHVSWAFRKAPKFFDIVTYTGTGSAQTIAHNLDATVGWLVIKRTDTTGTWFNYHHGLSKAGNPRFLKLDSTSGDAESNASLFDLTYPTSTHFTVGTNNSTNASGGTYVAYLFAHNDGDGDFGEDSDQDIIKCGSYTSDSPAAEGSPFVDLGFEPQWVLIKNIDQSDDWVIVDNTRGSPVGSDGRVLRPNLSDAEFGSRAIEIRPTGFNVGQVAARTNSSGETHIYVAIRRPHKPASEFAATDLFATNDRNSTGSSIDITSGFPVDWFFTKTRDNTYGFQQLSRLQGGGKRLGFYGTFAEQTDPNFEFDHNEKVVAGSDSSIGINRSGDNNIDYMFRRASGFFDVVAYTGNGTAGHTVNHNLGVVPELMIVKTRSDSFGWHIYASALGNTKAIRVDQNGSEITSSTFWNNTSPTSTTFTLGTFSNMNSNGSTFIAYLFASVNGVSKVGSYTGTGSDLNVDCGFSAGARFVLVKRTDSTGDWYVWDSERGIVAGNDPYLLLNSTAAEVTSTDYIDPLSSGFTVTSSAPAALNASGGTYIFLAIA